MMKPKGMVFNSIFRAHSEIKPITRQAAGCMIQRHYLGKWPGVCVMTLGLFVKGEARGIIVFALPPRETSLRYGKATWELARLWVCDTMPTNTETYFIARAIRLIKRTRSDVKMLVSYADPSAGHTGIIYKASNWTADGRTDQERKTPRFDYSCAATGKKFSRRKHIPANVDFVRVPRVSKYRFIYDLAV